MSYPDTTPRIADSNNNLLFKICQELSNQNGGAHPPRLADSDNNLLFKIAKLQILGGASTAALQAQITALQAQVTTFQTYDMEWEWAPTTSRLGNLFGYFQTQNDPDTLVGITSLTFKGTELQGGITLTQKQLLQSLSLPNVVNIGVNPTVVGQLVITSNPALTSVSAPSLVTVSNFNVSQNSALSSVDFSSLVSTWTAGVSLGSNPLLVSISLPAFVSSLTSFSAALNTALVNVSLPVYLPTNGQAQNFGSCALSQASVDHILARCVANAAYVSGTVTLNGGTSSTPSAAGLADKATLQARGVTVLNN